MLISHSCETSQRITLNIVSNCTEDRISHIVSAVGATHRLADRRIVDIICQSANRLVLKRRPAGWQWLTHESANMSMNDGVNEQVRGHVTVPCSSLAERIGHSSNTPFSVPHTHCCKAQGHPSWQLVLLNSSLQLTTCTPNKLPVVTETACKTEHTRLYALHKPARSVQNVKKLKRVKRNPEALQRSHSAVH